LSPAACRDIENSGAIVKSWDIYAGARQVARVESGTTLGHTRYSVTDALYRQVVAAGIDVRFGYKLTGFDIIGRKLTLESTSDSKEVIVDCSKAIVIAADGAASTTRRLLVSEGAKLSPGRASGYTPTRNDTTPWEVNFRVLVVDAARPDEVPLDPASHSIYNGFYCAITGPPNKQKWVVVPSAKKEASHADWFFLDSENPPPEAIASLRQFIAAKIPPLADTAKYFSDDELRAFFTRRRFTGSLVSLAPLHYPYASSNTDDIDDDAESWIVFLGDSAHSVFPATGEGLNSGLDDVLVFTESVLSPAYDKGKPIDLSAYTSIRQPDVDALTSLASEILSSMIGSPIVRATNIITMIVSSIARKLRLIGPSEAELRYGPNTATELLPYREVLRRHVRDTGRIRSLANAVVSVVFSMKSLFVG